MRTQLSTIIACTGWMLSSCDRAPLPVTGPGCDVSNFDVVVPYLPVYAMDVLLVIDNSPSMAQEQMHLRTEVPHLFDVLRTGLSQAPEYKDNGFFPERDLHIGIVSADLGLDTTIPTTGCSSTGDDGVLHRDPNCLPDAPGFVSYYEHRDDIDRTRTQLACNTDLGASGCGVVQPFEAALKALLPVKVGGNNNPFSAVTWSLGADFVGHGDNSNAGFLRDTLRDQYASVLVVFITNQDDCSVADRVAFDSASQGVKSLEQTCSARQDLLFPVKRYVDAFQTLPRAIRPYIDFAFVIGVPDDLVNTASGSNYDEYNPSSRDAHYAQILDDPRMQPRARADGSPGFQPACSSPNGSASPSRRFVELAHQLPAGSTTIRSVCADDLTLPVFEQIGQSETADYYTRCMPTRMVRNRAGLIDCRMTWELPVTALVQEPITPTSCSQRPGFLSEAAPDLPHPSASHGALCEVQQVSQQNALMVPPAADGFYYDTNSDSGCVYSGRIKYTSAALPPSGVTPRLHCVNAVQHPPLVLSQPSLEHPIVDLMSTTPQIGSPCDRPLTDPSGQQLTGDAICAGGVAPDANALFCHPETQVCAQACSSDANCPPGWRCEPADAPLAQGAGQAICVNPSCEVLR